MRRRRGNNNEDNGFAEWGGYMEAKKAKLEEQFKIDVDKEPSSSHSHIFNGVAIFVNGYSVPSADELKLLMKRHGGIYHHYYRSDKTTHIIATNLPDTKVKQLKNMNVVRPDWIVDSIAAERLLDYRQYLLYSRQSKTQPRLMFKQDFDKNKPSTSTATVSLSGDVSSSTGSSKPFLDEIEDYDKLVSSFGVSESHKTKQIATITENINKNKSTSHSTKTASEAGFLSEFYSNSRLHHISTMGATFKQYVNGLREKNKGVFPGAESLRSFKQNQINNTSYVSSSPNNYKSIIMHIDMDCFFVSVGLRKRPDLIGLPVAVTHSRAGAENTGNYRVGMNRKAEFDLYKKKRGDKLKANNQTNNGSEDIKPWSDWVNDIDESNSMSEIASCNYEARKLGLKNGMFLGQALKLCPNLKTIPYDFEGYKEVSYCLYDTVASYTVNIEAVSCDEMFVDCTDLLNCTSTSPLQLASLLRAEIKEKTGCPCSTGFGSNRLQARLATKQAKPDGQFHLQPSAVQEFMEDIKVSDLPGVGRSTSYKLALMGVKTCADLQQIPLAKLQSELGVKNGESLYKHCRGEDTKKLVFGQVRKSVSAEVNYGIRFQNSAEADTFLQQLAGEVHSRLQEVNMKAKLITLKLMVRAKDAPTESAKFLGHGVCDNVSRSSTLQTAIFDIESITREVKSLSRQLSIEPTELRGVGIQLSRLENVNAEKPPENAMDKFLRPKTEISKVNEEVNQNTSTTIITSETNENKSTLNKVKNKTNHTTATTTYIKGTITAPLSIDDFFAVKKHIPGQSKETARSSIQIKPADIDRDVLDALPEDIRREVMQEYGLLQTGTGQVPISDTHPKESDKPVLNDGGFSYSQIDSKVLDELPLEIKKEIQSSMNANVNVSETLEASNSVYKPNVSGVSDISQSRDRDEGFNLESLSVSKVRALIKAWTTSEECPQQCDINMLVEYLKGLVNTRQLVNLHICICCLHRCIEKRQCEVWQETYHAIVSSVQSVMVIIYGLHLKVPKHFIKFS